MNKLNTKTYSLTNDSNKDTTSELSSKQQPVKNGDVKPPEKK